jgi:hypothetical protein
MHSQEIVSTEPNIVLTKSVRSDAVKMQMFYGPKEGVTGCSVCVFIEGVGDGRR